MENVMLVALAAFSAGAFVGGVLAFFGLRKLTTERAMSITRTLFLATPFCAFSWVYISYAIAIYAMVKLGQVYTMTELSAPAITGIIAVLFLKYLENATEHNDGALWGKSNKGKDEGA